MLVGHNLVEHNLIGMASIVDSLSIVIRTLQLVKHITIIIVIITHNPIPTHMDLSLIILGQHVMNNLLVYSDLVFQNTFRSEELLKQHQLLGSGMVFY